MKRIQVEVRGRVQGVFFRQTALEEATRLGLTGWVRNRDDGSVEAVAEGAETALAAFVQWCHRGPPAAQVASVVASEAPATSEFSRFEVVR